MEWNVWTLAFAAVFVARNGFELFLDVLQDRHLARRDGRVPKHLAGKIDEATIRRAVAYNRDKLRLGMVGRAHGALLVLACMLVGFALLDGLAAARGGPVLQGLVFFAGLGLAGFLWDLPIEIWSAFGIEKKHGFNRQLFKSFIFDKLKQIAISAVLGAIVLAAVIALMEHGGGHWWIAAFAAVAAIQIAAAWLYPLAIMPLFNRFTRVDDSLAADVSVLADKVGFPLGSVVSMDGSRRSTHSNAFIVGLFGARRIVLYDTLVQRLSRPELLAVLAHELGHFQLRHVRRRLILVLLGLLGLLAALAALRSQPGLFAGLGFPRATAHGALAAFGLFAAEVLAPVGFLLRILSRRDERAADRFAVEAAGNGAALAAALVALTKQNLTSPGSHRWYRGYHNSHPALRDRLKAIQEHARARGLASDGGQVDLAVAPEGERREDESDGRGQGEAGPA